MRKFVIAWFCCIFFLPLSAYAETYKSEHFIIYSDMDPRLIKIIQSNIEAFYADMAGKYFKTGWSKPLEIYYSKDYSDTFKLLCKDGYKNKNSIVRTRISCYIPKTQVVYTYHFDKGRPIGRGVLFHEITHHFINLNYSNAPTWFNEGLATFFGDETKIIKGKAALGMPNPWREYKLKEQIEKGILPDVRRLYAPMTYKQFYSWPIGYNFSRTFFYWLYENKELAQYLQNAQADGYDISVLKKTANKPVSQINREILTFIKTTCYAGAYLYEAGHQRNSEKQMEDLLKSLELKPHYAPAQYYLARSCYRGEDYKKCRQYLEPILIDAANVDYGRASELMGECFYAQGDYERAMQYYQKALEYADYDEHKYVLYYSIGRCYDALKDRQKAEEFYQMFVANNWEREKSPEAIKYAREYQNQIQEPNDNEEINSN